MLVGGGVYWGGAPRQWGGQPFDLAPHGRGVARPFAAVCETGPEDHTGKVQSHGRGDPPRIQSLHNNMKAIMDGTATPRYSESGDDLEAMERANDEDENMLEEDDAWTRSATQGFHGTVDPDRNRTLLDWDGVSVSHRVDYLIVGAGIAAQSARDAILEERPNARVLVVGEEDRRSDPGNALPILSTLTWGMTTTMGGRAPLSQRLRQETAALFQESPLLVAGTPAVLRDGHPDVLLDTRVADVDVDRHLAMLSDGRVVEYKHSVLIASGAMDAGHHFAPTDRRARHIVHGLRTRGERQDVNATIGKWKAYDCRSKRTGRSKGAKRRREHVTVVGGGLVGVQTAYYLADQVMGRNTTSPRVSLVFTERAPLARYLPRYLANVVASRMERAGILLNSYSVVQYIAPLARVSRSQTTGAVVDEGAVDQAEVFFCRTFDTNLTGSFGSHLVLFAPTHLPVSSSYLDKSSHGLCERDLVHGGIVANSELSAASGVYVAGDAVSFPSKLGRRRVQWSVDHAAHTGYVCGKNMARHGETPPVRYDREPATQVDIGGTKIALIGVCSSTLETGAFWNTLSSEDRKKSAALHGEEVGGGIFGSLANGFLVYVRGDEIVGILLWDKGVPGTAEDGSKAAFQASVDRAKEYLAMKSTDRTIRFSPPPNSRSLECLQFISVVGQYVLGGPDKIAQANRRWEPSREIKYGLKERKLRDDGNKDELMYYAQLHQRK